MSFVIARPEVLANAVSDLALAATQFSAHAAMYQANAIAAS
jgi:hypothetical protein